MSNYRKVAVVHDWRPLPAEATTTRFNRWLDSCRLYASENAFTRVGAILRSKTKFKRDDALAWAPKPITDEEAEQLLTKFLVDEDGLQARLNKRAGEYLEWVSKLDMELTTFWTVIWSHLELSMKATLRSRPDFCEKEVGYDTIWLLNELRKECTGLGSSQWPHLTLAHLLTSLIKCRQGQGERLDDYFNRFSNTYDALRINDVRLHSAATTVLHSPASTHDASGDLESTAVAVFLENLAGDLTQFRNALYNNYSNSGRSHSSFPATLQEAYAQLKIFKCVPTSATEGTSFTQTSSKVSREPLLYFDSGASCSTVFTDKHLSNVHHHSTLGVDKLVLETNGGPVTSEYVGTIEVLGIKAWHCPDGIANVVSMSDLHREGCDMKLVTDNRNLPAFQVTFPTGVRCTFKQDTDNGMYVVNLNDVSPNLRHSLLSTVTEKKRQFTRREVLAANEARRIQRALGYPSQRELENVLDNKAIPGTDLIGADARRALYIYGQPAPLLKGKTVREKSQHVPSPHKLELPPHVQQFHQQVDLCVDFLHVNGMLYLHTISRKFQFRTISLAPSKGRVAITKLLSNVVSIYTARGLKVVTILGDNAFACVKSDMLPIAVNITAAREHSPEVERSLRTVQERLRCIIAGLPYNRFTKLMTTRALEHVVSVLNAFPAKNGVSNTLSPRNIVLGRPDLNRKELLLEFGTYVQVHLHPSVSNNTAPRTVEGIALGPSGNVQGGWYFQNLETGDQLHARSWTELSVPDHVIQRVNDIAKEEGAPIIKKGNSENFATVVDDNLFSNPSSDDVFPIAHEDELFVAPVSGEPVGNVLPIADENELFVAPVSDVNSTPDDVPPDDPVSGEPVTDDVNSTPDDVPPDEVPSALGLEAVGEPVAEYTDHPTDDVPPITEGEESTTEVCDSETENASVTDALSDEMRNNGGDSVFSPPQEAEQVARQHGYNLRPTKTRDYTHLGHTQFYRKLVTNLLSLTQMSFKKGLRKHGMEARKAMLKEFAQINEKEVFSPIKASYLTPTQRRKALRTINLIKEKRDGVLKGRTCVDGRPQRAYIAKEDASSPTMFLDSLTTLLTIFAVEKRHVATADVSGAYLHADMDEVVFIKLEDEMVDVFCELDNQYKAYVSREKNKRVLYLRLDKALYGCVRAALLWYDLFSGTLRKLGYSINPYDMCVANKKINGHQCTIGWYVDDTMIAHKDPNVVKAEIAHIEKHFGEMTKTHGAKHSFLGMNIEFAGDGTVMIDTNNYLREVIEDFEKSGHVIVGTNVTPAAPNMFDISRKNAPLSTELTDVFRSTIAKLLWASQRSRLDLSFAVTFLCSRLNCATEGDWEKLRRLLGYLKGTIHMKRKLSAFNLHTMYTWVDASYAVHPDMRSHTGGAISFGVGALNVMSRKQRLNTTSSTEAEVVGTSDYVPKNIWFQLFLEEQGYPIKENVLYQDNQSAIRLERNGRRSCGQASRHINIRYFFVKDRVDNGKLLIEYCPTESMLADFFTKPMQGTLFRLFRDVILGHRPISDLVDYSVQSTRSKERVGK